MVFTHPAKAYTEKQVPVMACRQSGATLIIVLVILIAMTFLGLGGMSDSNLQLAMVRNSQLQTGVYTAALTEINAQIDAINTNGEADTDTLILDLVTKSTTTVDGVDSRSLKSSDAEIALLIASVLGATDASAYTTSLTLTEPNANAFLPVTGMSISPDSTVKWLVMEFSSNATITNSGSRSDQIQGFKYLSAN